MNFLVRLAASIALLLATYETSAAALQGRVVGVHDGDTVTVVAADQTPQQVRVRLSGIDAPELRQPFGRNAKQSLSMAVYNKNVQVVWGKKDRYGRLVGTIYLDHRDINLEMIQNGMAWWYRQYASEQSREMQHTYSRAEASAQAAEIGLWSETGPVPPWKWRRKNSR